MHGLIFSNNSFLLLRKYALRTDIFLGAFSIMRSELTVPESVGQETDNLQGQICKHIFFAANGSYSIVFI